ncbi:MAG: polysaccharide deacetylase family protein [Gemmatimonadetes bacterium]|nr:polysaccharide deacetylase family protein [Gemmatimonadota bacterium]
MALLVTIHDVTPALQPRVETLWSMCAAHGIVPGLLVIPDWHGVAPIEQDPSFLQWVRARAADGAEIFLHGERHDEVGLPRGWQDEWRAVGRTNKEGEFLTLDLPQARARIDRGIARLTAQGLTPIGFVPPAWLARPDTHVAARNAGLAVSEDDATIYLHSSGTTRRSPVLRWSARGAFRSWGSNVQAQLRWTLQRRVPVMRIALHPGDLASAAVERSIHRALSAWVAERAPSRYGDL